MAKIKLQKITIEQKKKYITGLGETILKYKTTTQMEEFLRNFLTASELVMLARRVEIANGLIKGEGYRELRKKIGVGMSTVQSVDRWLPYAVKDYKYAPPNKKEKKVRKSFRRVRHGKIGFSAVTTPHFNWL